MTTEHNQTTFGVEDALRMLRRRGFIILLCAVLAGAAAYAFSKQQTKDYTATADLLFTDPNSAQQASGLPVTAPSDPQGQRATNLALVQLDHEVAQRTASALHAGLTGKQVAAAITPTGDSQSNLVSVSATWPSPVLAAKIANTFARYFVQQQHSQAQAGIGDALTLVQKQYATLPPRQQATSQGQSLVNHIESLRILGAMQSTTQVAQAATEPGSPSSPKVTRNTALGAVLGLILGLAIAFLLERLDRRLRDPSEAEQSFGAPMLGLVPHGVTNGRSGQVELEPFRMLRAHLRYFNVDRQLQTLLVTSAQPGEGKTTVAIGLASAASSMGTRTLLIEADLRRPTFSTVFGLPPNAGLSGVLVGAVSREEALHHVDVDGHGPSNGAAAPRFVDVLAAGVIPPNPSELLESHAMEDLLTWARSQYELIVVDTAPLIVVADSIPLMNRVDGVMVVTRLGLSTRDAASRLRDRLAGLEAPVLGIVVNDASRRGAYEAYGYDSSYASSRSAVTLKSESTEPHHRENAAASAGVSAPER